MNNVQDLFNHYRECASDFIYIFMSDELIRSEFNQTILKKKYNQKMVIEKDGADFGITYSQLKNIIYNQIVADYGLKPATIIARLSAGYTVYSKAGVKIGRTYKIGATNVSIDTTTGLPIGYIGKFNEQGLTADGKFECIYGEGKKPVQVNYVGTEKTNINGVEIQPGQQIATYNKYNKNFEAGAVSVSNQKEVFWSNAVATWVPLITNLITALANAITNFPSKADEVANMQSDGFVPTQEIYNPTNESEMPQDSDFSDGWSTTKILTTVGVVGAVGVGGYFLYKKMKEKKENK